MHKKKTFSPVMAGLIVILFITGLTMNVMAANCLLADSSTINKVKMYFMVVAKDATTTLYINGNEIPWANKENSMQTPSGVSVIRYTVSAYVNKTENIVGISASSTGSDPGVRMEVGRKETDTKWKVGRPGNSNWLKMNFDDKAWSITTPKPQDYNFYSQGIVNNPAYYTWDVDQNAQKVCFRQVIRGVEKSDQNVKYTVCDWGKVLEGLGYHRAIVRIPHDFNKLQSVSQTLDMSIQGKSYAVWAHVPWRRRDSNPEQKAIFIHDSKTGKRIENFEIINLNQEFLDVVFEPQITSGDYEIYFLPYFERFDRPFYWVSTENYVKPYSLCDENWLARVSYSTGNQDAAKPKIADGNWQRLPKAELVEIQSRTEFNSFYPMEVPATKEELSEIIAKSRNTGYLVFPEDRMYPVRMFETIPLKWVKSGPSSEFKSEAQPGEYYCFQIGLFAFNNDIKNIALNYSGLKNEKGEVIPATAFRCINTGGSDCYGVPFEKTFIVSKGKVRPLWIGFQVPDNVKGNFAGTVTIVPLGMEQTTVKININVGGDPVADKGDNEPWRHSRLRWLDSTLGLNDDELIPPYTPLKVSENQIECLARTVLFGIAGMPQKIVSNGKDIISSPMSFNVIINGKAVLWKQDTPDKIVLEKPARVVREAVTGGGSLHLVDKITMEADGMVRFDVTLTSKEDASVDAIVVQIPFSKQIAKYMTGGEGRIGGFRQDRIDWKMNPNFKLWLGDYDAGMQVNLLGLTSGSVAEEDGMIVLKAVTGKIAMKKDEELLYSFRLFVTPFKPINNNIHWTTRTLEGKADWATVEHYHHSSPENPWINYPFLTPDKLAAAQKSIIDRGGIGVQLYYTTRELTNRTVEIWALRSLGAEIFDGIDVYATPNCPQITDGHPWLREHLVNGFVAAWPTPLAPGVVDQAIGNSKLSRWHNYYIEGLNWLIRKGCISSLYIDGVGYDREIMKRVARSLSRANPEYRIEYHQQCGAGNNPGSPLNNSMEHMPYFTKLWFGESFNYNRSPDYWLVEISGIPFGITGEMLNNTRTANPWRGIIYGLAGRELKETPAIYRLWDDFGIQDSEWLGYWNPKCPVNTGRDDIMTTVYKKSDKVMICLASWAKEDVNLKVIVDWKALNLDPSKTTLRAPEIEGMQTHQVFKTSDNLPVKKAQGLILIAEERVKILP